MVLCPGVAALRQGHGDTPVAFVRVIRQEAPQRIFFFPLEKKVIRRYTECFVRFEGFTGEIRAG